MLRCGCVGRVGRADAEWRCQSDAEWRCQAGQSSGCRRAGAARDLRRARVCAWSQRTRQVPDHLYNHKERL
eukprot:scaffold71162_cov73-Phaeocystis_antarctica.AAC.4